jgi:P-type E1-E2 ATPase
MLNLEIPGWEPRTIDCLVLDMNGTTATDGRVNNKTRDKINLLAKRVKVFILTADTRGDAEERCGRIPAKIVRLRGRDEAREKQEFVIQKGAQRTIAVGNGLNDHLMLREAALGIAVIGREGISSLTLTSADVIVTDILDALDFLLKPLRHRATLRR